MMRGSSAQSITKMKEGSGGKKRESVRRECTERVMICKKVPWGAERVKSVRVLKSNTCRGGDTQGEKGVKGNGERETIKILKKRMRETVESRMTKFLEGPIFAT